MAPYWRNRCRTDQKILTILISTGVSVLAFYLLCFFAFGDDSSDTSTLQLVTVIFRHGDRTPTDTYPNDPYKNEDYWKDGWGALTQLGKQQMYSFGIALRKRYKNFLNEKYSPDDIYIVSSDHDRCLMSAQLCLAGLYPPTGDQVWNDDLMWQPIPVHTTPKQLDQLIVMRKPCPTYDRELNHTYSSTYVSKVNLDNADLYKYLSEKTGMNVNSILKVESLYNTLEIEERNNLKLPAWTEKVYPNKMKDLAALSLSLFTFNEKQKRLKGGPLLGDIVNKMSQKVLNTLKPNRKIFLYSGHDLNLVSFLRVLGFNDFIKPENGAAIFVELHKDVGGEYYIQLLYLKNTENPVPEVLKIPKCDERCDLTIFLELTKPFIPNNWDEECQIQ